MKKDIPGVHRFEAAHGALPAVRNAAKKKWKRKDSGTWKKREDATGGEHMIYCCDDCGFLFQRVGEIQECPSCESSHFRSATQTEAEKLRSLLKTMEENKEEEDK